mmetsp:Transcript_16865/g.26894  ORF Transcript_16865/g.26894 Transcript_16865/m.26894 type:complete len:384 (+) Transcript_16865:2657-3808(+)
MWEIRNEDSKINLAKRGVMVWNYLEPFLKSKESRRGGENSGAEMTMATTPKHLAFWLSCVQSNAFCLTDDEMRTVGLAVYPVAAMVNHSCAPNAVAMFDGKVVRVKAIRPVKRNQEISVSYVDLCATRTERQTDLKNRYGFDCRCKRCADPLEKDEVERGDERVETKKNKKEEEEEDEGEGDKTKKKTMKKTDEEKTEQITTEEEEHEAVSKTDDNDSYGVEQEVEESKRRKRTKKKKKNIICSIIQHGYRDYILEEQPYPPPSSSTTTTSGQHHHIMALLKAAHEHLQRNEAGEALEKYLRAIDTCSKEGLGARHAMRTRAHSGAAHASIELSQWESAATHLQQSVAGFCCILVIRKRGEEEKERRRREGRVRRAEKGLYGC